MMKIKKLKGPAIAIAAVVGAYEIGRWLVSKVRDNMPPPPSAPPPAH